MDPGRKGGIGFYNTVRVRLCEFLALERCLRLPGDHFVWFFGLDYASLCPFAAFNRRGINVVAKAADLVWQYRLSQRMMRCCDNLRKSPFVDLVRTTVRYDHCCG